MKRTLALICAMTIATGCDRRDRFAAPDSSHPATPAVPERSAYLSVSDLSPEAGTIVIVTGTLRVSDHLSLGSFRVRLGYDSTKLRFLEDVTSAEMLRVVNPRVGDLIIVGASSGGSIDGRLFAFRFRVDDPTGVNSLALRIDELNDLEFRNQKETVTAASALIADKSLAKLIPPQAGDPAKSGSRPADARATGRGIVATLAPPVIDSISPRSGEVENERVTDIAIYGRGFAPRGNVVLFGTAEIPGLMSEAGGTMIRFSAPSVRIAGKRVAIRVKHDGMESNAATFSVRDDKP
jgi:hypothetical protein